MRSPVVGFGMAGQVRTNNYLPRPLTYWTETFDTSLPGDIYTPAATPVTYHPTSGYGGSGCLLTCSENTGKEFFFNGGPTGRFWTPGNAVFTWYVYMEPGSRQICNCAFWVNKLADPYGWSGFYFRIQTASSDGGFHWFHSGGAATISGNYIPSVSASVWYKVEVTVTGTVANGVLTDLSNNTIVANVTDDVAPFLLQGRTTSGTMGQRHDGAGTPDGIRIDNCCMDLK